jgi:hypothetical protein
MPKRAQESLRKSTSGTQLMLDPAIALPAIPVAALRASDSAKHRPKHVYKLLFYIQKIGNILRI